eukprot:1767634-Alexandrium_andersonii.AAC.1
MAGGPAARVARAQRSFRPIKRPRGNSWELLAGSAAALSRMHAGGVSTDDRCSVLQRAERSFARAGRS